MIFFAARKRRRIAAAHHRQRAILRAGLTAGDGGVDKFEATLSCFGVKFTRNFCGCGGVVDQQCAFRHAVERTVLAEHDLVQVVVVADAGHHKILAGCRFLRCLCAASAKLGNPLVGFCGGPVVDHDLMPALGLEMARHRVTHDAQTQKCDFCHLILPTYRP